MSSHNSQPHRTNIGESSSSAVETSLNVADIVLLSLQNAATFAPIPYLKDAAGVALAILNVVQTAHGNKEAFRRLASDACELVYAVLCRSENESLSPEILNRVQGLVRILHSIQQFSEKQVKRNKFFRFITYKSDAGKITEHRDRLRQSLDVFGLQSSLSIHDNLTRIIAQQNKLVADIQERLDRAENLRLKNSEGEQKSEDEKKPAERPTIGSRASDSIEVARQIKPSSPTIVFANGDGNDEPSVNQGKSSTGQQEYSPFPGPNFRFGSSPKGSFVVTTIAGDKNETTNNSTVTNTNSGNTTTTTITGSYNDSSYRDYGDRYAGRRRSRQPGQRRFS